jgi:hypothetical protein
MDRRLGGPQRQEARGRILCPCRGSNPDRPVVNLENVLIFKLVIRITRMMQRTAVVLIN